MGTVLKNKVIYILILVFFFVTTDNFTTNKFINVIFDAGKLLCYSSILMIYFVNCIKKRSLYLTKELSLIFLYVATLLFTTLMGSHSDYYRLFFYYIPILAFIIFLDYSIRILPNYLFDYMLPMLEILVLINVITTVFYPEGIISSRIGFWGMKNAQLTYFMFTISLSMIDDYIVYKKIKQRTIGLVFLAFINFYLNTSLGSCIAIAVCLVLLLWEICTRSKFLIYRNLLILPIAFIPLQSFILYFARIYFGKGNSYLTRQYIWKLTMEQIKKSPIRGYGLVFSEYRNRIMNNIFANSAHNQVLEILYEGGILLLGVFIVIILQQYKILMRNKNELLAKCLSIALVSLYIGTMVEVQAHHILFFPTLILPVYYERLTQIERKSSRRIKFSWNTRKL